jgi:hypothetical protein
LNFHRRVFCRARAGIRPVVTTFPLDQANHAIAQLRAGGIDSISLNPDSFIRTSKTIAAEAAR